MIRFAAKALEKWLKDRRRKPMVLRGARQVGKTWLVRDLAKNRNLNLVELNFEQRPNLMDLFSSNDPQEIIKNIKAELAISIDPETSLLFLDEIQATPELLAKLRWFKEKMPELPVIAAGSLLEFAIQEQQFSMPVGRVTYFYLEQMSFAEFVYASGNIALYERLDSIEFQSPVPESLHEKYLDLYYNYCLIGGMPEVVEQWIDSKDLPACIKIQQDLLTTFRDDFNKYGGKLAAGLLARLMLSVSEQLGNKFVYSRVDPSVNIARLKGALDMLSQARVITRVLHTSGNGLPLGAESNEKIFKMIFLDIGLVSAQLGLSMLRLSEAKKAVFSNKGGLAEQFIGQQLRSLGTPQIDPRLYHWQRAGGRQGEVDYIVQHGDRIIPVEVKAGSAGKMKSLHQFMADKKLDLAIRCYTGQPSIDHLSLKTTQGDPVSYQLVSIPHYLVGRLPALLESSL